MLAYGCGSPAGETETEGSTTGTTTGGETAGPEGGQAVYEQPVEGGNTFACATCHAITEPSADGFRRPGHPIGDATRRPHYKKSQLTDMREAVNTCLQEWMLADPWTAEDSRWTSLYAWLDGQTGVEAAPPVDFDIVQPPADMSGGDANNGNVLFNQSCAVCHGLDAIGTQQAPGLAGLGLDLDYIGLRVRTSGLPDSPTYEGLTGGRMPFWSAQRLSDDELRDIAAWIANSEAPSTTGDPTDTDTGDSDTTTTGGDCGMTHPMIGWTAELEKKLHNVGGTAEIVDDCTIVISNFTYDGAGIDVRIYGGIDGNYHNGFAMTEDLLKPGGYEGVTLTATVPDGQTLDDLNGISVWCVDVGVDFGSGMFSP